MTNIPLGFVRVSRHKYINYAQRFGLSPLGKHLIVNSKMIGIRSNRFSYVDPDIYFCVFEKHPDEHNGYPGISTFKKNMSLSELLPVPTKSVRLKCPTCKSDQIVKTEKGAFRCESCGTSFLY